MCPSIWSADARIVDKPSRGDENPHQQDFVARARDCRHTGVGDPAMNQDQQADEGDRSHHAACDHRDGLFRAMFDTEPVPHRNRRKQARKVPEEQAQDADMKQDAAEPQIATMEHLRAIRLPRVLLALEAREAAEQEDDRRNVRINAK
jgi:hypothetical protein